MKIPVLHNLEKAIRTRIQRKYSPKSFTYKRKFERFLDESNASLSKAKGEQIKHSESPLVSIIIPCFNQFNYTAKCIESIRQNTGEDIAIEVIVIDDKSTDETSTIEQHFPDIRVIRNEENQGFLKNVNAAATVAGGDYLLLLNNDTIVLKNWLSEMLDVFNRFEDVGAVGSKLIFPNGMLQEAGGYITKDQHFGNYGKFQSIFSPKYNYVREVDYISGACLLIDKKLWNTLDGFDTSYLPAYFEDTDLCMRIREAGKRVFYTPLSNIIHYESISYGTEENSKKHLLFERNKRIFIDRWAHELKRSHHPISTGPSINFERNSDRTVILYVDEEPPNDYSCGSKLTGLYCDLMLEMGFSVKYLPAVCNPSHIPHIHELAQKGIEICATECSKKLPFRLKPITPSEFESWLEGRIEQFDHFYLARPGSRKFLKVIRKLNPQASYVYHPADLHFLRTERELEFSPPDNKQQHHHIRLQANIKETELWMLKNARSVLHVSTFEDTYLKNEHGIKNGSIIPCLFFEPECTAKRLTARKELMYVGGEHHASIDGINWFVKEIFPKILQNQPETILTVAGNVGAHIPTAHNIQNLGRVSDNELKDLYKRCIAVIPLRYGAGVKGKVLEAMNYKTPFVSTSVGLEGIISIQDCKSGCDSIDSFAEKVSELLDNPECQESEIEKCYSIINRHYTKNAAREALESVFQKRRN